MNQIAYRNLFDFVNYITNRFTSFPIKILRQQAYYCHAKGNPTQYFKYHYSGKPVNIVSTKGQFHRKVRIKCGNFINNVSKTTSFLCLDFDDHNKEFSNEIFQSTLTKLYTYGLKPIIIPTATGNGRHLYALFNRPVSSIKIAGILKQHFTIPSVDRFPKGDSEFGGNLWYPSHYNLPRPKRLYILEYFASITALPLANPDKFLKLGVDFVNEQCTSQLCKHPDIPVNMLQKMERIIQDIDLRWVFGDQIIGYTPKSTQRLIAKDLRSPTGDRDPSVMVDTTGRYRGYAICYRDDSIFHPIHYLIHFRGFNYISAVKYLFKFQNTPYDRSKLYDDTPKERSDD